MDYYEIGVKLALYFVPFLFALCFHEFAHGWVARLKGDRTAEMMGRLTLNPLAHIDPIGTVILPIIGIVSHIPVFGWAKPVPVNERNLKHPVKDMFWNALAGPLSNVLLAFVGTILLAGILRMNDSNTMRAVLTMDIAFINVNLILALFNLIPIHPLDGGKVVARFLPYEWNRMLEQNQGTFNLILVVLFLSGGIRFLAVPAQYASDFLIELARQIAQ